MNGLVEPDRTVKPHLLEVKKVYQYIGFEPVDLQNGVFSIKNKYAFRNLSDFNFEWNVTGNGETIKSGQLENINLAPDETENVTVDVSVQPEPGVEYFLNVSASLKEKDGLLEVGTQLAAEQFELPFSAPEEMLAVSGMPEVSVNETDNEVIVSGEGFTVTFDKNAGLISSYKMGDREFLQSGPVPNFWRAPIDNDFGNNLHKRSRVWRKAGENRKVENVSVNEKTNVAEVVYNFSLTNNEGDKIADYQSKYSVYGSGDVLIENDFKMTQEDLPEIVRMGMNLVMPREYDHMTWLGRGPHENYWDRKTSAFVGLYDGAVADLGWEYLRPQENGNRTDVRWAAVTNAEGYGLFFDGRPLLSVSAHHNVLEDFESMERTDGRQVEGVRVVNRHTDDVKPRDLTSVNIDYKQMGVGGDNSWGAWTHDEYRLTEDEYSYSFRMKAITPEDNPKEMGKQKL
jgi:beta-galactosidase